MRKFNLVKHVEVLVNPTKLAVAFPDWTVLIFGNGLKFLQDLFPTISNLNLGIA